MTYPFKKILLNCKKATLLSIKREEGSITLLERIELSYHLMFCDPCRNFIKQSVQLSKAARTIEQDLHTRPPFSLPADVRNRIKNKITGEL